MNQLSTVSLTADQLTEINKKIIFLSSGGHIIPAICILADHAKKMVRLHKLDQIANCMQLANKLYHEGNESEQQEITAIFFSLFSYLQASYTKAEWTVIKKHIPAPLYNAYVLEIQRKNGTNLKVA